MTQSEFFYSLNDHNFSQFSDPYTLALKNKTGLPVKYFNIENDYLKMFNLDDNEENNKLIYFLTNNKHCILIPMDFIDGDLIGFVCRSMIKKAFYNSKFNEKLPMVFGFQDFKDFSFGTPIVLTEGIKDIMTIKQLYKYSLAYLTSQPSKILFEFLSTITDRLIFIGDCDKAGKKLIKMEKYKGYSKYYLNGKDAGEYWDGNSFVFEELKFIFNKENII